MKKFIIISMLITGCASKETIQSGSQYPYYPQSICDVSDQSPEKKESQIDTSSKVKGTIIEGSIWVWNEAIQAYEWISSEENKERATKSWNATKDLANRIYNTALKMYENNN